MITYRVSATVKTRKKADSIVAALELLKVKAFVTESGPLGELLDAEDDRKREVEATEGKS